MEKIEHETTNIAPTPSLGGRAFTSFVHMYKGWVFGFNEICFSEHVCDGSPFRILLCANTVLVENACRGEFQIHKKRTGYEGQKVLEEGGETVEEGLAFLRGSRYLQWAALSLSRPQRQKRWTERTHWAQRMRNVSSFAGWLSGTCLWLSNLQLCPPSSGEGSSLCRKGREGAQEEEVGLPGDDVRGAEQQMILTEKKCLPQPHRCKTHPQPECHMATGVYFSKCRRYSTFNFGRRATSDSICRSVSPESLNVFGGLKTFSPSVTLDCYSIFSPHNKSKTTTPLSAPSSTP